MTLEEQPKEMVIVGSGAIGIEFAYFYNALGTDVTVVEFQNEIAPNEDHDISKELGKILKKKGINILTNSEVVSSKIVDNKVKVDIESNDKSIVFIVFLSVFCLWSFRTLIFKYSIDQKI